MPQATFKEMRDPKIRHIGALGPSGSFSHSVFLQQFISEDHQLFLSNPPSTEVAPQRADDFQTLLDHVSGKEQPKLDCCLIPFHNSSESFFKEIPVLLFKNDIHVVDIKTMEVKHCLLVNDDVEDVTEVKKIYTKDHIFKQCQRWLAENLFAKKIETRSSSCAAQYVKDNPGEKNAAIGGENLAKEYGLKILKTNIQKPNNFTTFFVLSARTRSLKNNPYVLYCTILNAEEDAHRINGIINSYSYPYAPLWTAPFENNKIAYIFQIGSDCNEKRLDAFETDLKNESCNFKLLGRLSKNVANCVIIEGLTSN